MEKPIMNKIKLINTVSISIGIILTILMFPLVFLPQFKTKILWKYLFTHRTLVMITDPANIQTTEKRYARVGGMTMIGYGINCVVLHHSANNMGVLFHELGHIKDPMAQHLKGAKVHLNTEPDASEVAADMYAVKHGYGKELIEYLEQWVGVCPDVPRRLEIIKAAITN